MEDTTMNELFGTITIFCLFLLSTSIFAQETKDQPTSPIRNYKTTIIPLKADNWEFKPRTVEFIKYKSRSAMKLLSSEDIVVLKNFNFTNGTIEYDMEPLDPQFTSIYFRWKNSKESECFYFRTRKAGNPKAEDAIQYAPEIDGVDLWDMLPHFQTNADFKKGVWNHVKLVISGKQLRAFVNDLKYPALEVPMLEGNVGSGTLAFDGQVIISNLKIMPNFVDGLSPEAGIDPTASDPNYIRKWLVSQPVTTAQNIDLSYENIPNTETGWENIFAERRGLINLTRKYGNTVGKRLVWLKTNINSEKAQKKILHFGFSDEVCVFINGSSLYVDKNLFNTPMAKRPDGRCSIENTSFKIPLKKGDNILMLGVDNFFYGWGIVARLDDLKGVKLEK